MRFGARVLARRPMFQLDEASRPDRNGDHRFLGKGGVPEVDPLFGRRELWLGWAIDRKSVV